MSAPFYVRYERGVKLISTVTRAERKLRTKRNKAAKRARARNRR